VRIERRSRGEGAEVEGAPSGEDDGSRYATRAGVGAIVPSGDDPELVLPLELLQLERLED